MTETEQYHAQAIDELTAKVDKLETQVELLTKHIRLMDGIHNKEIRSVNQVGNPQQGNPVSEPSV